MSRKKTLSMIALIVMAIFAPIFLVSGERYGGTMIIGTYKEAKHLNPALHIHTVSQWVSCQIYSSFTKLDGNMEAVPDLAKSWEILDDSKTWIFHFYEDVTWHDGEPFSSDDVKFTIEEIVKPYHPYGGILFENLITIETPDDDTAIMKFSEPSAPILYFLNAKFVPILPKHLYEGTDILSNPHNYDDVIGTGPFKFVEWVKGDRIVLEKNENYYLEGKPYLDGLIFQIYPDMTTLLLALEAGEVHYLPRYLPQPEMERVSQIAGIEVVSFLYASIDGLELMYNLRNPPLSDVRVRQALSYLIDEQEMMDKVIYGIGRLCIGPLDYFTGPSDIRYDQDIEKANSLLDEAGYPRGPDGIRFELDYIAEAGLFEEMKQGELMKEYCKEAGIVINIKALDSATALELVFDKFNFDIYGHSNVYGPDPSAAAAFLHSSTIGMGKQTNAGAYNNSRVDELFEEGFREGDPVKRKAIYTELNNILMEELPGYWITRNYVIDTYNDDFVGIPPGPSFRENYDSIYWVKGSAPEPDEPTIPEDIPERVESIENEIGSVKDTLSDMQTELENISPRLTNISNLTYIAMLIGILGLVAAILLPRMSST